MVELVILDNDPCCLCHKPGGCGKWELCGGCRCKLTERAALRAKLDEAARERMVSGGKEAGRGRPKQGPAILPDPIKGDSRDAAGRAVGVSGKMANNHIDTYNEMDTIRKTPGIHR
jgi:hypothetical protein